MFETNSRRLAAAPTDGEQRLGPDSKSDLRQSKDLDVVSPTGAMRPPGPDGDQELDSLLSDSPLISLPPPSATTHPARGINSISADKRPGRNPIHHPG
ncbi:putative Reverse transcriptase [Penicillium brevicompactum]